MAVFENLQALIELLGDAPSVAELTISHPGGAQITIKRPAAQVQAHSAAEPVAGDAAAAAPAASTAVPGEAEAEALTPSHGAASMPVNVEVLANRVGIYHPAKPPVEMGDPVSSGQIVGYIEAIKLMNEVRAQSGGTIAEQFVEEGMPVEYGQPLFRIQAE